MSWYSRRSWCGGPFNGENYRHCINIKDYRNERIDIHYRRECEIKIDELKDNFNKMSIEIKKITKEKELWQREQAANLSTYTDSEDSLIMENEELSTIPDKELDKFINFSVEDLVPILSEPDDTSGSDSEYDLSSCDDFSPIDVLEGNSVTFLNPLFDSNDNFTSSDDESLFDEDVPEDNVKMYSIPLFEFDDEYISSDVNPLFDEVLKNIKNKDCYYSNLDEPDLLVTPLFDANEDECFDPGGDFDEIDAFLDIDTSMNIKDDYRDSKGDILYLESLLTNVTIPSLPSEDSSFLLIALDFEESLTHGFVHRSLELQSLAYGNLIS
nr:hypothetical protein [Tanacetum cinerariifolium]